MIWVPVTDVVKPKTLAINYETEMSYRLLLWLKDDTFTVGWMCKDIYKKEPTYRWVADADITRMVTHWCATVEGPNSGK
jgi:hypothetical protein